MKKQAGFEDSLRRMEKIVETLEDGSIGLDDALKLYEEGVQLSKKCLGELMKAEVTLKRLQKDLNGMFTIEDEEEEE
jgi:exodeoxyribonuclease VII small subunit